jgi:hypothetical protein
LREWEACLAIAEAAPHIELPVAEILDAALDDFLETGRIATLRRWVQLARARQIDAPIIDLADGEMALRAGDYDRGLTLGMRVAANGNSSSLGGRAALLAARAAHLDDQRPLAGAWFERAEATAESEKTRADASYGRFLVRWEEEAPELSELLARLQQIGDGSPTHELRVAEGRILFSFAEQSVSNALGASRAAQALLTLPVEPLARLSATNLHAWTLVYAGRYAEALAAAKVSQQEAHDAGVDFVVDHALLAMANALIGLRRFANATRILDQIESSSSGEADAWVRATTAMVRARLQVSIGDLARAGEELLTDPHPSQTPPLSPSTKRCAA